LLGVAGEKKQICKVKQENPEFTVEQVWHSVCEQLHKKVGLSTVGRILKDHETWLAVPDDDKSRRASSAKHCNLEEALSLWFDRVAKEGMEISDIMVREQAEKLGGMLGITDFAYSRGWLDRFKKRHGLKSYRLQGESGSADPEVVQRGRADLQELLKEYGEADIYNADETGLFFRLTPSSTLATGPVRGKKRSKDRLTVLCCTNADGTDMRKLLVIGKAKKPRCFGAWSPNDIVTYCSNAKAWMTGSIFMEWLEAFNDDMKAQQRNVLLLLDNASSHGHTPALSNVRLEYLPPNTTAHLQPMDGGIIRATKAYYRRHQGRHFLRCIDAGLPMKVSVKDALQFIAASWEEVSQTTVQNCWKHVGILPVPAPATAEDVVGPILPVPAPATAEGVADPIPAVLGEIDAITSELQLPGRISAAEFVGVDQFLTTEETMDDEAIVVFVTDNGEGDGDESDDEVASQLPANLACAVAAAEAAVKAIQSCVADEPACGVLLTRQMELLTSLQELANKPQ